MHPICYYDNSTRDLSRHPHAALRTHRDGRKARTPRPCTEDTRRKALGGTTTSQTEHTLAFEIDHAKRLIVFQRVGSWGSFIDENRSYSYQDLMDIFNRDLLEPGADSPWAPLIDTRTSLVNGNRVVQHDFRALDPDDGEYRWYSTSLLILPDGRGYGSIQNIDEEKKRQLEERYLARHDSLTGLLNRRTFEDEAEKHLAKDGAQGGFAIIDVDNFKQVNDRRGHPYGDYLIKRIVAIMESAAPEDAEIGRFGGDEFVICCTNGGSPECLARFVHDLMSGVEALAKETGEPISVSMGSARFPQDGTTYAELLKNADAALLEAKKAGKNVSRAYSPAAEPPAPPEEGPSSKLRRGLRRIARGGRHAVPVMVVGLAILALTVGAGAMYLRSLQEVMAEETYTYLHEISTQLSNNTERTISTMQEKTEALGEVASQRTWANADELEQWLDVMLPIEGFSKLYVIDDTGAWLASGERNQQMFMRDFSIDVGVNGITRMSPAQNIGGKDYLALGVPLHVTTQAGEELVGLVSTLDTEAMREQFSLSAFEGVGYAHIITADGRAVMRSDQATAAFNGYNLFQVLNNATLLDGGNLDSLKQAMAAGQSASIHYRLDGVDKFATFTPVGIEDWYLASVLPTDFVYEKSNLFTQLTIIACVAISIIFIALIGGIMVVHQRSKKRLEQAAFVDAVTGGNTGLRFEQLASQAVASARVPCFIVYVNISSFKDINDRLGREQADGLLNEVYRTIQADLRRGECMGRIMADHFGVLVLEPDAARTTARFEEWARRAETMGKNRENPVPVKLNGGIYPVEDASIGVVRMLDRANLARQNPSLAAPGKRAACTVYDRAFEEELSYRKGLEDRAEYALEHGEFAMYLQPKHELKHGSIAGAEALVRWIHPDDGLIPPDRFIPLFEENGFITRLDLHVFELACAWMQGVIDQGIKPIPVSVNLSRRCFDHDGFLDDYEAVWRRYSFPAELLELEFTESILYSHDEQFESAISRIHEIGFSCSLDDFGAGYSSLNMLGSLNLDAIKMDRRFFATADDKGRMQTTIQSFIRLAKNLDMTVVAEGVEEERQVEMLRSFGCDLVQGFVFARPMPAGELQQRLKGAC